jgi:hypothetical protein
MKSCVTSVGPWSAGHAPAPRPSLIRPADRMIGLVRAARARSSGCWRLGGPPEGCLAVIMMTD